MNSSLFRSITPGSFTYELTREQLFSLHFYLGIMRYVLAASILFILCIAGAVALFLLDMVALDVAVPLILGLAVLDCFPCLLVFIHARRKSRHPDVPPGGAITLEWDSLSLSISAGHSILARPWSDVAWKNVAGGILFRIPDGSFAFVPGTVPAPLLETLRAGLRKP